MSTINSTQFKWNVEPYLNQTFDGAYAEYPKEYDKYLDVRPGIQRASHEEPVLSGFGLAAQKGQGEVINYDTATTAGIARYVYVVYSLAYSLTEELLEDGDHINIAQILAKHLGISMRYTKELVCAGVLNNGFNTSVTGYDGQPLFSASHVNGIAGSQSNTLPNPTPLSQAGLEQMIINIRLAKDGRGKIVDLKPMLLLAPPNLIFQAERLLKSVLQSGTANNDVNAERSIFNLDYMQVTRLSSTTNWFIKTDADYGLTYLDRRPINRQMMGDFDTGNMRYRATMRFAPGWTDFLGCYGALGTA